jgi:hypothetical protein
MYNRDSGHYGCSLHARSFSAARAAVIPAIVELRMSRIRLRKSIVEWVDEAYLYILKKFGQK